MPPSRRTHIITVTIFLITATLITGCAPKSDAPPQETAQSSGRIDPAVWVAAVERGTLEETVHSTGTLEGWEDVTILAKVSGTVTKINARLGDRLEEGQSILEIEPEVYWNAINLRHHGFSTVKFYRKIIDSTF